MAHDVDITEGGRVPLDHEALLTLARKVRAAASDGDRRRMRAVTAEFTEALDRHLRYEARDLKVVVPAQARILRKGQGRIATLASRLLSDASGGCQAPASGCEWRADELLALLTLQAQDERRAVAHQLAR